MHTVLLFNRLRWRMTLQQLQDLQSAQLFPNLTCFNALLVAGPSSVGFVFLFWWDGSEKLLMDFSRFFESYA